MITISLIYVNSAGNQKVIKKRVHVSLAVYKLAAIAKRVYSINNESIKLTRVSTKVSAFDLYEIHSLNT